MAEAALMPRQESVALLVMAGASTARIAELVGASEAEIAAMIASPLFRALVEHARGAILAKAGTQEAGAFINAQTLPSLRRIVKLRDDAVDEAVQLRAAQDLIDRNPATARVSKGRVDQATSVSDQVLRYIENLTGIKSVEAASNGDTRVEITTEPRIELVPLAEAIAGVDG